MIEKIDNELDFHNRLRLDEILAQREFDELINVAVETCLSSPDHYYSALDSIAAARVDRKHDEQASRLGLWGIRRHIETGFGLIINGISSEEIPDDDPGVIHLKMPVDNKAQNKIEAFGEALLEEAFLCLGPDAPVKVEEFIAAESIEKKYEIGKWLLDRVIAIRDKPLSETDEEQPQDTEQVETVEPFSEYHPVRLSPKLIGRYPDNRVSPTCLGVSLLIASFFKKADIPYLHAGVAESASNSARFAQICNVEEIENFCKEREYDVPFELAHKFKEVHEVNGSLLRSLDGYHAAVIANIDGVWVILDPNFHIYQACSYETGDSLDSLYDLLKDISKSVRGIDVGVLDFEGNNSLYFTLLYEDLKKMAPTIDEIDEWLMNAPEDMTIHELVEKFLNVFLDRDNRNVKLINWVLAKYYDSAAEMSFGHYYIESLKESFRMRVFSEDENGSFENSIKRCKSDPHYRLRRAEDLFLLPFLTLLRLSSDYGNSVIGENLNIPHPQMEVGMPSFRIGACVLSDFAVQCGFDLPSGVWLNNWASNVALTEHLPPIENTEQVLCAKAIGTYLRGLHLKYVHTGGIISQFLEQGEKQNGI